MICSNCGFDNTADDDARFCASCGSPLEPSENETIGMAEALDDGSSVDRLGPYELHGELGRGAMARVWRAYDPNLRREVAIKEPMFDQNLSQGVRDEMGRRFIREAKTAARLNHPGIVTIYTADVYDGNRPAIVMELVEGATLGEILDRQRKLDPATSLDALNQLLDAVGYAHAQGVVHRDIKPDNIFVSSNGRVKLADFGIARVEGDQSTRATQIGTVLGTPGYMSPEQARGASVDSRSDLFSIGVVGYEMLSGRNPFGAGDGSDSTTLLYRIVHEPAGELPEAATTGLPADIRPAIMAALAKDPNDRPQTAEEFKSMLQGGVASSAFAGASQLSKAAVKSAKPKWLPYVLVAAACVVVLAVVLSGALSGGSSGGAASNQQSSASSAASSSPVYLAVKDGKVAIFTNSSTEPYVVSDVEVSDLNDEAQKAIENHEGYPTVEAAQVKVDQYRDEVQKGKEDKGAGTAQGSVQGTTDTKDTGQATAQDSLGAMFVVNCNEFITLRSQPDASASELNRIPLGAHVDILEGGENGFTKVSYKGQTGYALARYLGSINSLGYESKLLRVVNCNEWISLRTAPDTSASTITRIPLGDSARYISEAGNGFYQVSYNGQVGYALAEYLTEW